MIYADVYQPPKSASYFNQLPADLFDITRAARVRASETKKTQLTRRR